MLNAIRCINQRLEFKNTGISCLALKFNLNNPRSAILYTGVAGFEIQRVIYCFFLSPAKKLWLSGKGELQITGQLEIDSSRVLKLSAAPGPF